MVGSDSFIIRTMGQVVIMDIAPTLKVGSYSTLEISMWIEGATYKSFFKEGYS